MIFGGPARKQPSKGIKEALFDKQKGKCMYCGRKMTIRYLHTDHKIPVIRDGSNSMSNLQLLCSPCNGRKGKMTDGEFRRQYDLTPARKAKGPPSSVLSQI